MTNIKAIKENLVTDLRKFCANAGFTDIVFGLSGGMDSALVLALACEALGSQRVHTFMMKTKYTSQLSINLANEIAQNMGNHHQTIDIQPLVDGVANTLTFTPQKNVTLENVQARVRGLLCMMYSNEFNWMVLACGNKSEIAMGYCTLYGDTCGAVMPLGDLYKTQVYEMAELYNREGKYIIPAGIISRPATAELAHGQKDSDSLPSYNILDPILQNIEQGTENQVPENLAETLASVKKRMHAASFKRAQLPPILKTRVK